MQTQPYPAVPAAVPDPAGGGWRDAIAFVRTNVLEPGPPPAVHHVRARFLWGLAQPLLGMRVILRDRQMLGDALFPVVTVAAFCAIGAWIAADEFDGGRLSSLWAGIVAFFAGFIALAPVPPFLFARHYARMAARARALLELDPRDPWLEPIGVSLWKTIAQSLVIALGGIPFLILLAVPLAGTVLVVPAQGLWTLHWMVVEGLDNGRTLVPGTTVEQVTRAEEALRHDPWFHRWLDRIPSSKIVKLLAPLRMLLEIVRALGRPWSHETRLVEEQRAIASGFGIGVVALLAIPGLNLFFRPALVVGAAHLRGQIERE
jgi:hypothetical protein